MPNTGAAPKRPPPFKPTGPFGLAVVAALPAVAANALVFPSASGARKASPGMSSWRSRSGAFMPPIQSANAGSASARLLATAFLAASISPGNTFHRAASFSSVTTVM